jgi:hypothetical protein
MLQKSRLVVFLKERTIPSTQSKLGGEEERAVSIQTILEHKGKQAVKPDCPGSTPKHTISSNM